MTDYATLTADVASFSARSDLAGQIPTFIRLAEARIARRVRVIEMQTNATLTVGDTGRITLPERFLGFRSVYLASVGSLSGTAEMTYISPDAFHERDINGTQISGITRETFYTIESGELVISPAPGTGETTDVAVVYWERFPALTDTAPLNTNWLLTNHFDIYLCAVLAELYDFIMDEAGEIKYDTKYSSKVDQLHRSERRKARSGPNERRARENP